jgi:hypothetical protein
MSEERERGMKFSLLLTMIAGLAFPQARPQDVTGWGKINWGMTIMEARSVYPSATGDGTKQRLTLDPIQIGDLILNVSISARTGSDRVARVELSTMDGSFRRFDRLKVLLMQKYGPPIDESTRLEDANTAVTTLIWTFPSASILLTLRQGRVIELEYLVTDEEALGLL